MIYGARTSKVSAGPDWQTERTRLRRSEARFNDTADANSYDPYAIGIAKQHREYAAKASLSPLVWFWLLRPYQLGNKRSARNADRPNRR